MASQTPPLPKTFPPRKSKRKPLSPEVLVALIAGAATITAAIIGLVSHLMTAKTPIPENSVFPGNPPQRLGRIEGRVVDKQGRKLTGVRVGVIDGPDGEVDQEGEFILAGVAIGDQVVSLTPASRLGSQQRHVQVNEGVTTRLSLVYDPQTSKLGILSIIAPVEDGRVSLREYNKALYSTIYGSCDGLGDLLGKFEIWVIVGSQDDRLLHVQNPQARIDPTTAKWHADVAFGDPKNKPYEGQAWDITAVAAPPRYGIGKIPNTPSLHELPPHIQSNLVRATVTLAKNPK